jgi:hypothetical protein
MGIVLNWSTGYNGTAASVDDRVSDLPTLADGVHDVMASHVNALADICVELETNQADLLTTVASHTATLATLSPITVREIDGAPSVSSVNTLEFTNGSLADMGGGVIRITTGGGTLQSAYDGGNTVNVLSSTDPVQLLTTDTTGEVLSVESDDTGRTTEILGVRDNAFSPHALAVFGDIGGDKLAIWADAIRGNTPLLIKPDDTTGHQLTLSGATDGGNLVMTGGAGIGLTNGGDITVTAGNGGGGGATVGGDITITAGNGGAAGTGGSIAMYAGSAAGGTLGTILLDAGTTQLQVIDTTGVSITGDLGVSGDLGIGGELAVTGVLTSGSAFFAIADRSTNIDVTLSNTTDYFLRVDTSGANRNITLPNPASRRSFLIKKITTDTNTITLVRFAAENIETAAASYALPGSSGTGLPAWTVWSDGTNWWVA